jgi:hypothetical protein
MLETMLLTHSILVKAFLGFLVLGLFIPMMTKNNPLGFKKSSFIYTMIFQAIMTMIVFVGIIAMVSADIPFAVNTAIMVGVFALMMAFEIIKYKKIKMSNTEDEETFKILRGGFVKTGILNIVILVIMVVLMILKAKGVVSI